MMDKSITLEHVFGLSDERTAITNYIHVLTLLLMFSVCHLDDEESRLTDPVLVSAKGSHAYCGYRDSWGGKGFSKQKHQTCRTHGEGKPST